MKNDFLIHLAAKIRRNKVKWRVASAMLAGIALLFAFQGFSSAEDDDDHNATEISNCTDPAMINITQAGRYFLADDLKQCVTGVAINVSDVKLELRGHTIQGVFGTTISVISVDGGGAVLSNVEIAGPGTVTGGMNGITFKDVHSSRVHNLVVVGNQFDGISINTTISTNASTAPTDDKSHDNEFYGNVVTDNNNGITMSGGTNDEYRDNVVTGNAFDGIQVNGGNENRFIHNDLSGNFFNGLNLLNATDNVARRNTADANSNFGIVVGTLGSRNIIEDNIALGNFGSAGSTNNGPDLVDQNGDCTHNSWGLKKLNSFNTSDPTCIK